MSVEVERKFLCSEDTLKTLEEIRAVCVGQRQFHDEYFDTPKFDLTLRGMWLRKRKGCWELKCPSSADRTEETSGKQSKAAALCTRYKEITSLPEIQLKVQEVIKDVCEDGETSASQEEEEPWLSKNNLVCFAEFTTVRRSFTLEEDGVQIDLDQADFGYHVGEIEVLVPEGGDVQPALEKIERTARKLGVREAKEISEEKMKERDHSACYQHTAQKPSICDGLTGDQRVEGKMNVYLKRKHPEHYARLLRTHVL